MLVDLSVINARSLTTAAVRPIATIDLLAGIHAAVSRIPWSPSLPERSFLPKEATATCTVEGDYAEDREVKQAIGHLADFAMLSDDIESLPEEPIKTLSSALTSAAAA